jgi:hypothetical protein
LARGFLQAQAARLGGETPAKKTAQAFAQFCQVLLETNEFVYRP